MDKVQQLIDKLNKEVEEDYVKNPFLLKVGQFVCVNESSVYKIIKFSKDKGKCYAVVNLVYSDEGNKVNKLKPTTVDLEKVKPIIVQISSVRQRIEKLQKLEQFILQNISDTEYCKKFDNIGNPIKK